MANYKVVDADQLDADLKTVADAIREKGGTTESLEFPLGMKQAVESIETGIMPTGTFEIAENGTYDVTNYASAKVNVAGTGEEDDAWIDDTSEVIFQQSCYQNANISAFISKNGTLTYKRTHNLYAEQKPNWVHTNFNHFATNTFLKGGANHVINVRQAEVVNNPDIPEDMLITTLGRSAFGFLPYLKVVKIPSSITTLDDYVFANCESLKSVALPETVTTIGTHCFYGCASLEEFEMPPLVTSIPLYMFNNCYKLKKVNGIERMVSIGANSFDNCVSLCGVLRFNEALDTLASNTFRNCLMIEKIMFAGTPSSITNSVFSGCVDVTDIYVPWSEGEVANAPWGATNATIHYNTTYDENHNPIV